MSWFVHELVSWQTRVLSPDPEDLAVPLGRQLHSPDLPAADARWWEATLPAGSPTDHNLRLENRAVLSRDVATLHGPGHRRRTEVW
jgi:hypothetical protein